VFALDRLIFITS